MRKFYILVIVVLVALLLVLAVGKPKQRPQLAISFGGYTNDQAGTLVIALQLANRGNRFVDYSLGTAEVLMPDGTWKAVGEPILETFQELRPKRIDRLLVPLPAGADRANWRVPVSYIPFSTKSEEWIRKALIFLKLRKDTGTPVYGIYSPELPANKIAGSNERERDQPR